MLRIKDIYAGKPDAKDEINALGDNLFFQSFFVPQCIDVNSILDGDKYYITGFKGVGKTALLYYLDQQARNIDEATCTSFIFFKSDYPDQKREELEHLSRRLTTLYIDKELKLDGADFEYIWRWILYCHIINDHQDKYSRGLFVENEEWNSFVNCIKQIKVNAAKASRFSFPTVFKLSIPVKDTISQTEVSPEFELDLSQAGVAKTKEFSQFCMIIDNAENLFKNIIRTNIPYYIFIDELEAYYGEHDSFIRDLKLLRDLILTVHRINQIFIKQKMDKTRIICSVRSEILNSIQKFITSKEINKTISGFEIVLKWNFHNTNSYQHPIIQMLLKRIKISEYRNGLVVSDTERIKTWFPQEINGHPAPYYILNNSWCKPRDIVRLLLSAQNNLSANNTSFSKLTFDQLRKTYSADSMNEIIEEMKALYEPSEIDRIIGCLTGFPYRFSFEDIRMRAIKNYPHSMIAQHTLEVLQDLYRLGVIGNYNPTTVGFRWHHKGDDRLIVNDEWDIMIHQALQSTLSSVRNTTSPNHKRSLDEALYPNNKVMCLIEEKVDSGLLVTFEGKTGEKIRGIIPYENTPANHDATNNPAYDEGRFIVGSLTGYYAPQYTAYVIVVE